MKNANALLRNHLWAERRHSPRLLTPFKLTTDWRTLTMHMFLIGTVLPIHNTALLILLGLSTGTLVLILAPAKVVVPNDCADPNIPWWRWIAEGCWMLAKKVTL